MIRTSRGRGEVPQGHPSTRGREARDPRFDEIMQTLREFGHIMDMQARVRPEPFVQAAVSAAIARNGGACRPSFGLGGFTC